MIAARGTGEDQGPGVIGKIADAVAERINGSHVTGLSYPATLQEPAYEESESKGVESLQKDINNYFDKCPDSKVAVFGYSQVGYGLQTRMSLIVFTVANDDIGRSSCY